MKTYVITLSKTFPVTHKRALEYTDFKPKLFAALNNMPCYCKKLHTIRANYELWKKRFEEIAAGKALLSVRQWTGKPYRSKQVEIRTLTKDNGIGIQKLKLSSDALDGNPLNCFGAAGKKLYSLETLANNDGLTIDDWREWFKGYDLSKPLCIIHFTPFRYE